MDKQFISLQKELIQKKIDSLRADLKRDSKYEDLGSSGDDEVQEFEEFEEKTARAGGVTRELAALKKALAKIEDGTYGICEKCKQPIEEARLKALPESRYCASDK